MMVRGARATLASVPLSFPSSSDALLCLCLPKACAAVYCSSPGYKLHRRTVPLGSTSLWGRGAAQRPGVAAAAAQRTPKEMGEETAAEGTLHNEGCLKKGERLPALQARGDITGLLSPTVVPQKECSCVKRAMDSKRLKTFDLKYPHFKACHSQSPIPSLEQVPDLVPQYKTREHL
ncbi:Hypothetical predicted protein [Podarcis lilfordi]|uniref:Uncharacterized protein n=1 Tax=Podarcis lilfordi TaxID=74358 RepID=A0AA35PCB8_9SAUR|nr:Hypothetical predicted protein [Podarcis lilfordi]